MRAPPAAALTLTLVVAIALCGAAGGCTNSDAAGAGAGAGEGEGEGDAGGVVGEVYAEPTTLAFGIVDVGASATLNVVLRNRGTAPADITDASLSGDDAESFSADIGGTLPERVLPGEVDSVVIAVSATPLAAGPVSSTLTFTMDDGASGGAGGGGDVSVTLSLDGRCVPTASIGFAVDGAVATAPFRALFGADIEVLVGAVPCRDDAPIITSGFEIVSAPPGTITDANGIVATGRAGNIFVRATAADALGNVSAPAEASIEIVPRLSLFIEDALLLGLEPHVYRDDAGDNGERCTALDCFDTDGCGFLASAPPEWDALGGERSAGDPFFEELAGVHVASPVDGAVLVLAVYGRNVAGAADANVTLTIEGAASAQSRTLAQGELWTVARTTWPAGGAALIESVDLVEPAVSCP